MKSFLKFEKQYVVLHSMKTDTKQIPPVILFYWESILQDCLNMFLKVFTKLTILNDLSNGFHAIIEATRGLCLKHSDLYFGTESKPSTACLVLC